MSAIKNNVKIVIKPEGMATATDHLTPEAVDNLLDSFINFLRQSMVESINKGILPIALTLDCSLEVEGKAFHEQMKDMLLRHYGDNIIREQKKKKATRA